VVENNRIYLNERAGIYALSTATTRTELIVSGNTIHRNKRSGIRIEDNVSMIAANNTIYENETAGISSYTLHKNAPMLDAYQNSIYSNDGAGIFIHAGITGQIGLTNNLIHNNYRAGIACGLWGELDDKYIDVEILHNTIFGNGSALEGAGIRNDSDGDVLIKNNIIAYNFKTGIMTNACQDNSYNLLFANGETSTPPDQLTGAASFLLERIQYAGCKGRRRGDVLAVPEFVNPDLHNFSLRESSPAIGAASRLDAPYFQDLQSTDIGVIPTLLPDDFFPAER
jgi:parallel beta-helix repeat protein